MSEEPGVPDAEMEVLACLWQKGEATARGVREALESFRPLTHSAVSTLLSRLQERGLVTRRKGPTGKAFLFRAAKQPQQTQRRLLQELRERIFGGDTLAIVSSLFETRPPTLQELQGLEELLDQLRNQAGESGKKGKRA